MLASQDIIKFAYVFLSFFIKIDEDYVEILVYLEDLKPDVQKLK